MLPSCACVDGGWRRRSGTRRRVPAACSWTAPVSGGAKTSACQRRGIERCDHHRCLDRRRQRSPMPRLDGALSTCSDPSTSFCDDFERASSRRWDRTKNTGGVLEKPRPEGDLQTAFRAGSSGVQSDQYVYLEKSLPVATKNVRCEFDLFADPAGRVRRTRGRVLRLGKRTERAVSPTSSTSTGTRARGSVSGTSASSSPASSIDPSPSPR